MKKLYLILFIVAVALKVNAQTDVFPAYSETHYNIGVDTRLEGLSGIRIIDSVHRICNYLMLYELDGMMPLADGHNWIDTEGGTLDASTSNTPTALLCKLLKAYKSNNFEEITQLYRTDDAIIFDTIYNANPELKSMFMATTSLVTKMDLILTAHTETRLCAFITMYNGDTPMFITPANMVEEGGQWKLAMTGDRGSFISQMNFYLQSYNAYDALIPDAIINDLDSDGVPNADDNCPCAANSDQTDSDGDGVGDVCDNCLAKSNPDQSDLDNDGLGDVCDNCPLDDNCGQTDTDHDGVGDACDVCPYDFDPQQEMAIRCLEEVDDVCVRYEIVGVACDPDIDGDGIPNEIDPDMDGDGWLNEHDNCPRRYNPEQTDSDNDGVGDVCDNCKLNYNPGQEDIDHDGIGDACDDDADGDGIPNKYDNCPYNYNPEQEDENCNGIGDACEEPYNPNPVKK